MRVAAHGAAAITGTIRAVDDVPQGQGVVIVVDAPAPGIVLASAMDCARHVLPFVKLEARA